MRDGFVVKNVPAKETDVAEITRYMVGRSIEDAKGESAESAKGQEKQQTTAANGRIAMSIRRLWVDMPGEMVRDVNLDVKEGEILGIGGTGGAWDSFLTSPWSGTYRFPRCRSRESF